MRILDWFRVTPPAGATTPTGMGAVATDAFASAPTLESLAQELLLGWAVVEVTIGPGGIRQEIKSTSLIEAEAEETVSTLRAAKPFLTDYYKAPYDQQLLKRIAAPAVVGRAR